MKKVAWGILSTANIGIKRVIPAIMAGERGVVAAIGSRDGERAAVVAKNLGIPRAYGSYEALLDDPAIDAIIGSAATGKIGDGKIFIYKVDEAVRIRNHERGVAAL